MVAHISTQGFFGGSDSACIPDTFRDLLETPAHVTCITFSAEGRPEANAAYQTWREPHLYVCSKALAQRGLNMTRDPRVMLVVIDSANPHRLLTVHGMVEGSESTDGQPVFRVRPTGFTGED